MYFKIPHSFHNKEMKTRETKPLFNSLYNKLFLTPNLFKRGKVKDAVFQFLLYEKSNIWFSSSSLEFFMHPNNFFLKLEVFACAWYHKKIKSPYILWWYIDDTRLLIVFVKSEQLLTLFKNYFYLIKFN